MWLCKWEQKETPIVLFANLHQFRPLCITNFSIQINSPVLLTRIYLFTVFFPIILIEHIAIAVAPPSFFCHFWLRLIAASA
ncbi:hypothetical protein ES332_A05G161300v1 [Gossypium tomentosum]|uniref:Uncharacterized protein n=1 Tax=Gossypium tomentosum TaxID=34277 RepID=A0A5D2QFT6_GOSTO|nr:hypothetical protein ES332_A05G161300v1 [Gossypium tomentosum]